MTVLTTAAGLLGELAFGVFNHGADRFTVSNLGLAHGGFDVEFALHAVDENFEVEFAHTGNNRLAGFFVRADAEGRVFLSKTVQSESHLFLVGLGLRFDSLGNNRLREFHAFEDDRSVDSAERVTRRNVRQAHGSGDVAGFHELDFLTFVGVHLEQTADTFLLTLDGVHDRVTGVQNAGVDAEEGQLADVRVGHDLERESGERSFVLGFTEGRLFVEVETFNRRNVGRGRQELHDGVEHALHALVLEGGTAKHRLDFAGDGTLTKTGDDVLFGEFAVFEVLVHELFGSFRSALNHLFVPFLGNVNEVGGDVDVFEGHALRLRIPNDALHLDEVDNAFELVFSTDGHNDGNRIGIEALLHLFVDLEEVGTGTVHLVHEGKTGNAVLVGLTPNGFGLRLHAAHGAVDHAGAVEDAHGTFNFNGEVNVPRGVDDVQTIRFPLHFHAAPEGGGGSGRNRDATFLFLFHPVHGGGAIMHFTDLVVDTGVEQNTFGRGGLARVNVGRDTDIAVTRNRGLTSHLRFLTRQAAWRGNSPCSEQELEAEVREGLVGFSHTMDFVTLLHGAATAFGRVEQFAGETLRHGLFRTLLGRFTEPAHGEGHTADRTDFDRNLIVGTTNAAGLDFHQRTDVVQGGGEHFQGVLAGLFFDLLEGAVNDAFGHGLLAVKHDHVDELGNFDAAELRVGKHFALRNFATTGHLISSFVSSVYIRPVKKSNERINLI